MYYVGKYREMLFIFGSVVNIDLAPAHSYDIHYSDTDIDRYKEQQSEDVNGYWYSCAFKMILALVIKILKY